MEKNDIWAPAVIRVLLKPLFAEETEIFQLLCSYSQEISSYLFKIGLELVVNRDLGYAFVRQHEGPEEGPQLPKLIRRVSVTFEQSLVLVLLYDELEKFDGSGSESVACIIEEQQVRELAMAAWPGTITDEPRFQETIGRTLSDIAEQGLIRERKPYGMSENESQAYKSNRRFELRNIIRARVTKDFFEEFKRRLLEYRDTGMISSDNIPSPDENEEDPQQSFEQLLETFDPDAAQQMLQQMEDTYEQPLV